MSERRHTMRYQRRQWELACRRHDRREEYPAPRPWTQAEEALLLANYNRRGCVWCAVRVDRTPEATRWHWMVMNRRAAA